MKVLADVSAGQAVTDALRALGHDVLAVRDRDPHMADVDILAWAVATPKPLAKTTWLPRITATAAPGVWVFSSSSRTVRSRGRKSGFSARTANGTPSKLRRNSAEHVRRTMIDPPVNIFVVELTSATPKSWR
jgi:hypothetical protein